MHGGIGTQCALYIAIPINFAKMYGIGTLCTLYMSSQFPEILVNKVFGVISECLDLSEASVQIFD